MQKLITSDSRFLELVPKGNLKGLCHGDFADIFGPNYPEISGSQPKSLASIFQVAIRLHPGHLQPKTLANSFSVLIYRLLTKIGHYL